MGVAVSRVTRIVRGGRRALVKVKLKASLRAAWRATATVKPRLCRHRGRFLGEQLRM